VVVDVAAGHRGRTAGRFPKRDHVHVTAAPTAADTPKRASIGGVPRRMPARGTPVRALIAGTREAFPPGLSPRAPDPKDR